MTAEIVLVTVLLLVVGRLIIQEPAREELAAQEPAGISIPFELATGDGARASTLTFTPGVAGPNDYRLEVGGDALPEGTEAVLRLDLPSVEIGAKELKLTPAGDNAFVGSGSELAISGAWNVEVIVRKIGAFQGQASLSMPVLDQAPVAIDRGTSAWHFEWPGIAGLLFIVVGCGVLLATWALRCTQRRFQTLLGGGAAVFLGAILLIGARIPATEATLGGGPSQEPSGVGMGTPVTENDLRRPSCPANFTIGHNTVSVDLRDLAGAPVTDAAVTVESRMVEMDMGVSILEATQAAPGVYTVDRCADRHGRDPPGPGRSRSTRPGAGDIRLRDRRRVACRDGARFQPVQPGVCCRHGRQLGENRRERAR